MPIYEYHCGGCGREFEKYVPTAATAVACPHCESPKVKRRLSVVGVKTAASPMTAGSSMGGGGCCGGGCGCR
jgi:putative FmdB family regulatory protein